MRKQRTKASALANAPPLVEHDTITPTGYANDDNYTEESPDSTVSFQLKQCVGLFHCRKIVGNWHEATMLVGLITLPSRYSLPLYDVVSFKIGEGYQ